jgi:hypothetical protein
MIDHLCPDYPLYSYGHAAVQASDGHQWLRRAIMMRIY